MTQVEPAARAPFSASDAAFAGFGILQRRPSTLLVWGAVMLVYGLVVNVALVGLIGPQMQALRAARTGGVAPDPAAIGRMFAGVAPFQLINLLALLLIFGLFSAAVNRALLRPQEGGPGYLAFGADELLQIALAFIWGLIVIVAFIGLGLLFGLLIGVSIAAHGRGGTWVIPLVGGLALLCGWIWISVRLSLAPALTFDTRQLHLLESFRLTRGRFWPLFGAYFLTWVIILVISLVYVVVLAALAAAFGGGFAGMGQLFNRDTGSFAALLAPIAIVSLVLGSFVNALLWALMAGAPAGAYAQLRPSRLSEVF